MVIKFPLATMLDFLQGQLTVILRYSPRQKSFYPSDGILGELFFLISVNLNCSCQKDLWQIMQAELLFRNETYKLCIFVNFSNKKNAVIGQNDLNISSRVLRCARSTSQSGCACIIGEFLKHLKIFDDTDFSLILFDTALVLLQKVSCTSTKKKLHNALARGLENRGRGAGDGRGKGGDASPKRVGSERNKRKLRSIANYFAMKKPRKKSREPGLQCTGGGRLATPPPVLSPSPASLTLTAQTVYNILTDCLRLFS